MTGRALRGLPNRSPQSCEQRETTGVREERQMTETVNRKTLVALALAFGALLLAVFASGTGPKAGAGGEPPGGAADLARPDGGHHGLLHVPQLRAGPPGPGRADHGRHPGRGAELRARTTGTSTRTSLYKFSVDNDRDGRADDVELEFKFRTEPIRGIPSQFTLPLSYVGGAGGLPPITALDGPGSEGLGLRQRYSVTLVRGNQRTQIANNLIAVPSNVGPRTMPNYDSLAAQGTYRPRRRDQGLRRSAAGPVLHRSRRRVRHAEPAACATDRDARRGRERHREPVRRRHALGLQRALDRSRAARRAARRQAPSTIGAYASTSRPTLDVQNRVNDDDEPTQVQRLANPLVNETIIGTVDKDRWNALEPRKEQRFEDYYLNPRLALALELVFGVPADKTNRTRSP